MRVIFTASGSPEGEGDSRGGLDLNSVVVAELARLRDQAIKSLQERSQRKPGS